MTLVNGVLECPYLDKKLLAFFFVMPPTCYQIVVLFFLGEDFVDFRKRYVWKNLHVAGIFHVAKVLHIFVKLHFATVFQAPNRSQMRNDVFRSFFDIELLPKVFDKRI